MLQYLIILLDDTAVSYCHYPVVRMEHRFIGLDTLKQGILFAMKENLNIQFVYPDYELPQEYKDAIETIDHVKIQPMEYRLKSEYNDNAHVIVFGGIRELCRLPITDEDTAVCVVRTTKAGLFSDYKLIGDVLGAAARINMVITDVETFTDDDFYRYKQVLGELSCVVERLYVEGKSPQINILTDRMMLDTMNNCGAGDISITLAPDGKFYTCPAFYQATPSSDTGICSGDLKHGLDIKNRQLYCIDHAPLCRICDAYQCRRCVWLNRKITYEINTPGHEQCVVAHLERNASRELLNKIRKRGTFLSEHGEIKKITYLDPFEIRELW